MEKIMPAMLRALVTAEVDLSAATPGGIEASERMRQRNFVRSSMMPANMAPERTAFEALGFTFGAPVDDIFLEATLPPAGPNGPPNHAMHSDILDEHGVRRVSVFYKAAFYDRRARACLLTKDADQ